MKAERSREPGRDRENKIDEVLVCRVSHNSLAERTDETDIYGYCVLCVCMSISPASPISILVTKICGLVGIEDSDARNVCWTFLQYLS